MAGMRGALGGVCGIVLAGCAGGPAVVRPGGSVAVPRPDPGAPIDARLVTGSILGDLEKREAPGTAVEAIEPPELEALDSAVSWVSYDTTAICFTVDDHQPATTRTRMANPYESLEVKMETSDGLTLVAPTRSKARTEMVHVKVAVGPEQKELAVDYMRLEMQFCFVAPRPILMPQTTWVRLLAKFESGWQGYTFTLQ